MKSHLPVFLLLAAPVAVLVPGAMTASAQQPGLRYNADIRPILSENCFAGHGPDSAARKANLRLDTREYALSAGAITPGQPATSKLISRIMSADTARVMPPVS